MNDELELIRGFLTARLDMAPERITPVATLEELDIDSLMLLEMFFEFEEKLNVRLSKDLPTPKTIGELIKIVHGLRGASAAS
jgi:acyl carrier protein